MTQGTTQFAQKMAPGTQKAAAVKDPMRFDKEIVIFILKLDPLPNVQNKSSKKFGNFARPRPFPPYELMYFQFIPFTILLDSIILTNYM